MTRLLSDVDGKISHVLLCLAGPRDIRRVASIVATFDKEVEITIACHHDFGKQLSSQTWAVAKNLLRGNLSVPEQLAVSLPGGRRINLLPMHEDPWIWAQDLIHVLEKKILVPSISETENVLSDIGRLSKKTSSGLLKQQFWIDHQFTVAEATEMVGLGNSDGGDLIVCGETVFVGDGMIGQHLKYGMNQRNKYVRHGTYAKAKDHVLRWLSALEEERTFCVLPFQADHLDMVLTPISEDCLALADIEQTIDALRLSPNVSIQDRYKTYASALQDLAGAISSQCVGVRVIRIPCVPPLVCNGRVLNHFTSYNNIVQEKFRFSGGNVKHRAYIPIYSHSPELFRYVNPANWSGFLKSAIDAYRAIGLEVRNVPFLLEHATHFGGGLRCSVKVLERAS